MLCVSLLNYYSSFYVYDNKNKSVVSMSSVVKLLFYFIY